MIKRLLLGFYLLIATNSCFGQTFIHSRSSSTAREAGNAFKVTYGGPTGTGSLSGNFLDLTIVYPHGSTVSSISDGTSTYTLAKSQDGGVNSYIVAKYIVPNVTAGIGQGSSRITVTFGANVADFHAAVKEFSGLSQTSGVGGLDGTCSGTPTAPTVNCSSAVTPTVSGDVVIVDTIDNSEGSGTLGDGSAPTAISPGSSFNLIDSQFRIGYASEFRVYNSTSALTPSLSVTQGTNDGWILVAIFVKASGGAGTNPTGATINHITSFQLNGASVTTGFPFTGNTIAILVDGQNNNTNGNIVTVSSSSPSLGTFTKYSPSTGVCLNGGLSICTQILYATGLTPSGSQTITLSSGNSGNTTLVHIFDISSVSSHDVDASASCTSGCSNTITNAPSLTPTKTGEPIVSVLQNGNGPETAGVSGIAYMNINYTGETDAGQLNNGNAWSYIVPTNTSTVNFGYTQTNSNTWSAVAVSFQPTATASGGGCFLSLLGVGKC